jgi:hypothetical protein
VVVAMAASQLFRENAKALCFDALIDKEEFIYKSEGRTHHAVQLDPRKRKNLD